MGDFDRSKGLQDILMSLETYELLVAERNADLEIRDNFHRVGHDSKRILEDGSRLSFLPSNHMLGSCQVALELSKGPRIGYSSDFGWPLDEVIKVDQLVVDSTYGSPGSVRHYTQAAAEECLFDLVCARLRHGPVHIRAHRGTVERVLQVIGSNVGVPILATKRLIQEIKIYHRHGFAAGALDVLESDRGQSALKERSYVRLYSKGDGFGNEPPDGTSIACSAFMMDTDHPLKIFSDQTYTVALSNHADFDETLAYVQTTGAKKVVTDNTRGRGVELAIAINDRFAGAQAEPSTNKPGPRWN